MSDPLNIRGEGKSRRSSASLNLDAPDAGESWGRMPRLRWVLAGPMALVAFGSSQDD